MVKLLSIDVGGTFIKYGLYDLEFQHLESTDKVLTPRTNFEDFTNVLFKICNQFWEKYVGVALSVPGTIDAKTGLIIQGGSLQYNNQINLVKLLEGKLNVPVTIENDARCALLAELWRGKLKESQDGVMLTDGTGIGGAIAKKGKVILGSHRTAGEFSALLDSNDTKTATLKGRELSFSYFVQEIQNLKRNNDLDGVQVMELISEEDPEVLKLFDQYTTTFARLIYNLQLIVDPASFIIGGGVSQNEIFMNQFRVGIERFYNSLSIPIPRPTLTASEFRSDANLIGAVRRYQLGEEYINTIVL